MRRPAFGPVGSLKNQICTQDQFRTWNLSSFFAGGRVVGFVCFRVAVFHTTVGREQAFCKANS